MSFLKAINGFITWYLWILNFYFLTEWRRNGSLGGGTAGVPDFCYQYDQFCGKGLRGEYDGLSDF